MVASGADIRALESRDTTAASAPSLGINRWNMACNLYTSTLRDFQQRANFHEVLEHCLNGMLNMYLSEGCKANHE